MRVFVVEDEQVVARRLLRLVEKILGDQLESLDLAATLNDALEHIRTRPVDVLFLDLNLQGQDGFRLLHEAAAQPFQTVVVSAQHEQALRAFEYGVTDFVAKPYDETRLRTAISRLAKPEEPRGGRLRYLAVKKAGEITPVPIESICYIKGADDYSEIHCEDGSRFLHAKTLAALEQILPSFFERLHRSYIVNTNRVSKYLSRSGGQYLVRMVNDEELPVSRAKFAELKGRMP